MKVSKGGSADTPNGLAEFVAQEEMSRFVGYWWSPDSKHIAFLQLDESPVQEFVLVRCVSDQRQSLRRDPCRVMEIEWIAGARSGKRNLSQQPSGAFCDFSQKCALRKCKHPLGILWAPCFMSKVTPYVR